MTREQHLKYVSKRMSRGRLAVHWTDVLYLCKSLGMVEKEDATDLWNVLNFIEQLAKKE